MIVGFAAEHGEDAVELGRGKLERKRLDAIVVNDISRAGIGFESDENEVTILDRRRRASGTCRGPGRNESRARSSTKWSDYAQRRGWDGWSPSRHP